MVSVWYRNFKEVLKKQKKTIWNKAYFGTNCISLENKHKHTSEILPECSLINHLHFGTIIEQVVDIFCIKTKLLKLHIFHDVNTS